MRLRDIVADQTLEAKIGFVGLLNNNKKDNMIDCIKCAKKGNKTDMCLNINDIIEDHVSEKTIDNFEKNYLKGMSIENYFCGTCASQSLKIMERGIYG